MSISVLVADPDVRGRLWLVDCLRSHYLVSTPGPGESPLQAARRDRPQVVLLAVPRGRSSEAIQTCRLLKTDASTPPLVGLVDPRGRLAAPERGVASALADGYFGGPPEPSKILEFLRALVHQERPLTAAPPEPGLLRRLAQHLAKR